MRTAIVWLALAIGVSYALTDKNSDREQVQALVKEGKSLEDEGKLLEARAKYTEAGKEGAKELAKVNKQIAARAGEIVTSAKASFEAKDYAKAIEQLQQAHELSPDSPDVNCDLGVSYHQAGNDAKAVESLQRCVVLVKKPKEKSSYEQLITQIETKDKPTKLDSGQEQTLTAFNQGLRENQEVLSTPSADAELCKKLLENQSTLPKTPSILFNLAKCSEDAGKLEDAVRYFSEFASASPDSIAVPEAKDAMSQLALILAFDGVKRDEVRAHYSTATQYLVKGRYSLALKEYENVRDIAPDFAFDHRQLGLFYEALGRDADATRELNVYAGMDGVSAEDKEWVSKEVAGLQDKRAKYEAAVRDASAALRPLLFTGRHGADTKITDDAIQQLQTATGEFALAPEANRLLGFLYVEANYPAGAKRAYDASTSGGVDPFFFAWVSGMKDTKGEMFSLIRVKTDGLQIEPIYSLAQKKKFKMIKAKKGDALKEQEETDPASCNSVMTNTDTLVPQTACGAFFSVTDIRNVESKATGIEVEADKKPVMLRPVNMFQEDPITNGPAARRFANRYVRVIQRYMENDITKLGSEHMTGGEKVGLGLKLASAASGGISGAMSAVSAAGVAINVSMAAIQTMQMLQQMRMQNAMLARAGVYKAIPVEPAPLEFRVD